MILTVLEASQFAAKQNARRDDNSDNKRRRVVDTVAKKLTDAESTVRSSADRQAVEIVGLGLGLSVLFVSLFVLFVLGAAIIPGLQAVRPSLAIILPGFRLFSWWRILLGLFESFAWGWYVAVIFGSSYNYFLTRRHS